MILTRLPHDLGSLVDFYQEALEHLGAACERTWFDRLEYVAEGHSARPWHDDGRACDGELHFPSPETEGPRDAQREVFPGCPLTFRLAESLRPSPLALERGMLAVPLSPAPLPELAEKIWRAQWPSDSRWRMESPFVASFHFSLVALARCEIQAIDQHWSLHRLVLACPGGEPDPILAEKFDFMELTAETPANLTWPVVNPALWREQLNTVFLDELAAQLESIRRRQENSLGRELQRIDHYFAGYELELSGRARRSQSDSSKAKIDQRLNAARAEHARRRVDQVQRHEIRVIPRLDALLLLAEPAWKTTVMLTRPGEQRQQSAHFVPRARRWFWG
jgi:hypothetical protein